MLEQHYITQSDYRKAVLDDVYERISKNANNASSETQSHSYFEDALILQVVHDLKDQLGYDETKAYNAVYSGGLKIYSTQDTEIQKIADQAAGNDAYFPSGSRASLIYSLSTRDTSGNDVTYSENNVLNYMKENHLGDSLIFSNASEAKSMASKFKNP